MVSILRIAQSNTKLFVMANQTYKHSLLLSLSKRMVGTLLPQTTFSGIKAAMKVLSLVWPEISQNPTLFDLILSCVNEDSLLLAIQNCGLINELPMG
ncbi:hypothetical protein LN650_28765 [Klebsiella pneumoniae subsp. pneumoniae]|nr:hypothetical protein [Klebsiella pneumoniae subsp. pneumoniae]